MSTTKTEENHMEAARARLHEWNEDRRAWRSLGWRTGPMHGIRAAHRRNAEVEMLTPIMDDPYDPWAMIDDPGPRILFGDELSAPGADDR